MRAQEARDATVLIHEATFDDDMEAEAMSKRHSMTKEAVQTGVDARVYRTILTHFSQRYPKIPVWDHSFSARTGVAFDLMAVNFGDLEVMRTPTLHLRLLRLRTNELLVVVPRFCMRLALLHTTQADSIPWNVHCAVVYASAVYSWELFAF